MKYKSHERESLIASQLKKEDGTDVEKYEDDDSHMSDDDTNRFSFVASEPVENAVVENNLS